jgi:hypothetical protein
LTMPPPGELNREEPSAPIHEHVPTLLPFAITGQTADEPVSHAAHRDTHDREEHPVITRPTTSATTHSIWPTPHIQTRITVQRFWLTRPHHSTLEFAYRSTPPRNNPPRQTPCQHLAKVVSLAVAQCSAVLVYSAGESNKDRLIIPGQAADISTIGTER